MFRKVLVANRGEIALRIIQSCRELGIKTVAVFSEADRDSLHVRLADEAICIGPAEARKSYLSRVAVLAAAEVSGAEALHPGYGFLAEDQELVGACEELGLVFIGPSKEAMRLAGDKLAARREAAAAGIPVLPGSGALHSEEEAKEAARQLGYPLVIKAVCGGGGRGIRVVHTEEELLREFHTARQEAQAAFAEPSLYLERYLPEARHIEVQILADHHGTVVHWGERDCSIQRRYQKLVEEAPAPNLDRNRDRDRDSDLRGRLREAAVSLARRLGYRSVGTVEFLLDPEGEGFYFIELNARIQVEHPVSEMLVGRDLIKEQIRIAAGEPLGYTQEEVELLGHAIECRINAEDPAQGFAPSIGRLKIKSFPSGPGVRIDTHIYDGMEVTPYYDSLLAKVITWGRTREEARLRMAGALARLELEGVATTRDLCQKVIMSPPFTKGECTTASLKRLIQIAQKS